MNKEASPIRGIKLQNHYDTNTIQTAKRENSLSLRKYGKV